MKAKLKFAVSVDGKTIEGELVIHNFDDVNPEAWASAGIMIGQATFDALAWAEAQETAMPEGVTVQ